MAAALAVLWMTLQITGPIEFIFPVAIVVAVIPFVLYYAISLSIHRRAKGRWEDLSLQLPLDLQPTDAAPAAFWHLRRRSLRLPALMGTYQDRPVRVEAEHLPHSRSSSYYMSFLSKTAGVFITSLKMPIEETGGFEMKVELRQPAERTETRIDTPPGQQRRTPFEREHHLFTNDDEQARAVLDPRIQKTIESFEQFVILRVEETQLELVLDGVVTDPRVIREGLELLIELAGRMPEGSPGEPPGSAETVATPAGESRST